MCIYSSKFNLWGTVIAFFNVQVKQKRDRSAIGGK